MDDAPAPSVWHHIAIGDRGSVPNVVVVKDWGHELQVAYHLRVGGGMRQFFWIRREDFIPAPPLAP